MPEIIFQSSRLSSTLLKKNPTAQGQNLDALAADTPTVTSTLPSRLPDGGVAETRKATSNEWASFIGSSHSLAEYEAQRI